MSKAETPRYRFGPLERRGVLAGLRGSQLATALVTGIAVVASLRSSPSMSGIGIGMALACLGAAFAFVPISGRTGDEWLPVLGSWLIRSATGGRRFVSPAPSAGVTTRLDTAPFFPPALRDVQVLAHPVPGAGHALGVVKDRRHGTYTGVLAVQGRSFALLDAPEKSRRLSAWAGVLAGLAREGAAIHRVQWIERTVPDSGDEIGEYLKRNIAVPLDSRLARSYLEIVDEAGPVTQEHELLVALQIHAGRCGRAIKAAGGGDSGACEVLRRELAAIATTLSGIEVTVEGALTPRLLAHAIRTSFDPSSRADLAAIAARDPERAGAEVGAAGPMATEESWSSYRSDGAWHATYWVAEWPRVDTDADFLAPLLLRTEAMRTVSLVMEPISPLKAIRTVEAARTSAAADEELRQRAGFVLTSRRKKEQDSLADHERDLSDGHAFYRFSGYITVTASTPDELVSACGEIEEAAGRCFLDIRRLVGSQAEAFTYSLPLCRGLH
jgi:hypothetical protein